MHHHMRARVCAGVHATLSACLHLFMPACLHACISSCLPVCMPACLPVYLFACLTCQIACRCVCPPMVHHPFEYSYMFSRLSLCVPPGGAPPANRGLPLSGPRVALLWRLRHQDSILGPLHAAGPDGRAHSRVRRRGEVRVGEGERGEVGDVGRERGKEGGAGVFPLLLRDPSV